jgi:hypothetical protein
MVSIVSNKLPHVVSVKVSLLRATKEYLNVHTRSRWMVKHVISPSEKCVCVCVCVCVCIVEKYAQVRVVLWMVYMLVAVTYRKR